MNVLHITTTDPAGSVLNFVNALNRHTDVRARVITTVPNAYNFPTDIGSIYDGGDEIEALLRGADVIHLHKVLENIEINVELAKRGVTRKFLVADTLKAYPSKKVVYHIHGHPFERNNVKVNAETYIARKARVLCSTPDLEEMYRAAGADVSFFPNCVPVNDVRYLPRASDRPLIMADGSEKWCVAQSPTHAILKNVATIEAVMRRVGKELNAFFLKIQGVDHDAALCHKRNAHVVFDHMEGYYGLSSLEALSMGKPTIAGLSEYTVEAINKFFSLKSGNVVPWVLAKTENELESKIRWLLSSEEKRRWIGEYSRKFMEEVWSDRAIGQRLAAFYRAL